MTSTLQIIIVVLGCLSLFFGGFYLGYLFGKSILIKSLNQKIITISSKVVHSLRLEVSTSKEDKGNEYWHSIQRFWIEEIKEILKD